MEFFYLVSHDRPPVGPVSADQLHALHASGAISDATLVSPVGGGEWRSYADAIGNAPLPMPVAAAAPPSLPQPPKVTVVRQTPPAPSVASSKKHSAAYWIAIVVLSAALAAIVGFVAVRSVFVHKAEARAMAAQHSPRPHPMGDWYELGFQHGGEVMRSHEELGMTLRPERQQITHLFKDLGVDLRDLPPEGVNLFYQGYVDAVEQRGAAYRADPGAVGSSLPEALRER